MREIACEIIDALPFLRAVLREGETQRGGRVDWAPQYSVPRVGKTVRLLFRIIFLAENILSYVKNAQLSI